MTNVDNDRPPGGMTLSWADLRVRLNALLAEETDGVAAMATVATELHLASDRFDWTGFYRVVAPRMLAVGPYQGGHGCLRIGFDRGVCGAAARTGQTQRIDDVHAVADHIACSSTTASELVVPVFDSSGTVVAVIDIDSNQPAAFTAEDQAQVEAIAAELGARFVLSGPLAGGST